MDLTDLHPGHVIIKVARYRFVVAKSFDTKTCPVCKGYIHRKTKYVRISKGNKPKYGICYNCVEEEIESYGNKTK